MKASGTATMGMKVKAWTVPLWLQYINNPCDTWGVSVTVLSPSRDGAAGVLLRAAARSLPHTLAGVEGHEHVDHAVAVVDRLAVDRRLLVVDQLLVLLRRQTRPHPQLSQQNKSKSDTPGQLYSRQQ